MNNVASTYQTKERQLSWDEENRLRAICDNGYVSSYFYDAGGERTVKLHGSGEGIHVNGVFSGGYTNNADYTLYVNAYMVLEKGGQYTKHIYIGDQRIVSKLGDVGSFGVDPRREQYAGEDVSGTNVPDYKTKYKALQQVIKDNYELFEVDYYAVDNDNYVDGEGFCCEPQAQSRNLRSIPTQNVDYEKLQYYYHSDHLGSANYITNLDGEVVQHVEYIPFGEVFIEERNNTWNTPYLFNGKELDEETGLYYYGARYYNPRISLWYGVDPLAEKYPAHSPYCYTMNNPVMLVDPDGRKNVNFDEAGNYIDVTKDNWLHNLFVGNRGRILNSDGSVKQKFRFADPENDVADIQSGKITKLITVSEVQIRNMLVDAGAFNDANRANPATFLTQEGRGGGKFDFSFNGIPGELGVAPPTQDANDNWVAPNIFLVDGVAHNHMNFGNFMFGAGGGTLGVSIVALKLGAHRNSRFPQDANGNRIPAGTQNANGYEPQWDSSDDQYSIECGYNYARGGGVFSRWFGGRRWDTKSNPGKVTVGPLSPGVVVP